MLTIKAPIELKCSNTFVSSCEAFGERIRGSYTMLTSVVTGEDLLHAVTEPPEVYLLDEGMGSLVSHTTVNNRQEEKISVINQLLNRILVSNRQEFTYQDKVYITGVLQKLGIYDVQNFMTQVAQIKEETDNTSNLISLYWQHMSQLQQMVEEYHATTQLQQEHIEQFNGEEPLYLHQEIMNRLQTGAVYQILQNFKQNRFSSTSYIAGEELQFSEYQRMTQNILLNKLENTVRREERPLIYRHENYYEEKLPEETELTEQVIQNQVTSAVLLQLIDNLYQSRSWQLKKQNSQWYHMEHALYQSAENTKNRFYNRMTQNYYSDRKAGEYITQVNRDYRQEIALIDKLFKTENYEEQSGGHLLTQQFVTQNRQRTENREDIWNTLLVNRQEETNQSFYQEETDNRIQHQEENEEVTLQQLKQINRQNIENRNKYVQALQMLQMSQEKPAKENIAKRTRQDSLRALSSPEEVLLSLRQEAGEEKREQEAAVREALQFLPQETKQIYEVLEQYMQTPERMKQSGIVTTNNVNQLLHDIQMAEQDKIKKEMHYVGQREEIQQISEQVVEKWQEQPKTAEKQEPEAAMREALQLLPRETEQIYEVLEQYMQTPERMKQSGIVTVNNVNLLLQDIQEAEQDKIKKEMHYVGQREEIQQISERVVEKWQEQPKAAEKQMQRTEEAVRSQISLIHKKETQNRVDEEVIEQLIQERRSRQNETRITEQVTENTKTVERNIHRQNTREVTQQAEDIVELVQRGVQRQIGDISEQVYNKLERRLQNERRRRGY